MKRFYKKTDVESGPGGHAVRLDGRPVRTPKRNPLVLPTAALAQAVADEWADQGADILPSTMRLTGLANAAIDIVAADKAAFVAPLAAYAGSDLVCYRAQDSALERGLRAEQAKLWDPLIAWYAARYLSGSAARLALADGIMPIAQDPAAVAPVTPALMAHDPFRLAAMAPLISIGGSVIVVLAMVDDAATRPVLDVDAAWDAVTIDERWQEDAWGADDEAVAQRARRRTDWDASAVMLALLAAG
jgi:chaperone required for assembly of F1-ATPase